MTSTTRGKGEVRTGRALDGPNALRETLNILKALKDYGLPWEGISSTAHTGAPALVPSSAGLAIPTSSPRFP